MLGHATSTDIVKGLTTATHKDHNNYEDKLADSGVDLHTASTVALSVVYVRRATLMENIVRNIHRHIMECMPTTNPEIGNASQPTYWRILKLKKQSL